MPLLLGEQVVRHVVAIHRLLGLARGDEDVFGAHDLVGDGEEFLLELRERFGQHAFVFDGEVVQPIQMVARPPCGEPPEND